MDVLKVMHPEYDFIFLYDHSAGHAKQRPDGLNQHRMNKAVGGKAVPMRDTLIEQEEGFLGQLPRTLEPGDTQSLVFFSGSDAPGPFWMSDVEKENCRHDKHLGTTTEIKLTVPELILQLRESGFEDSLAEKTIQPQLRTLCAQHGLSTQKSVANVHKRNRSELEISLLGRGINTKGKNKRELVELCEQKQIATTKNVEQIKEGWEGQKAYYKFSGNKALSTITI